MDVEYCDVITIKGKDDSAKSKTPFFLRGTVSSKHEQEQS